MEILENSYPILEDTEKFENACKTYENCTQKIADLTKSRNSARAVLKALCPHLSSVFESEDYMLTTSSTGTTYTITAKDVKEKAPELYAQLEKLGLVKKSEPAWKIASVKAKVKG